jgi:anti-sigma28 factor (negative regulator of flagellin synthesis)
MEIEFNTSRIPPAESSPTVSRRDTTSTDTDAVSFSTSDSLKSKLNNLSTARPEQVAKAKEKVADGQYPPDYVLNRVAVLLAINVKSNAASQSSELS